ncbi:hypothetical protein ACTFIW_005525 [Dictyostelium discoideum]
MTLDRDLFYFYLTPEEMNAARAYLYSSSTSSIEISNKSKSNNCCNNSSIPSTPLKNNNITIVNNKTNENKTNDNKINDNNKISDDKNNDDKIVLFEETFFSQLIPSSNSSSIPILETFMNDKEFEFTFDESKPFYPTNSYCTLNQQNNNSQFFTVPSQYVTKSVSIPSHFINNTPISLSNNNNNNNNNNNIIIINNNNNNNINNNNNNYNNSNKNNNNNSKGFKNILILRKIFTLKKRKRNNK